MNSLSARFELTFCSLFCSLFAPNAPQQLYVDEAGTVEQWFDGRILASYLVSTGRSVHKQSSAFLVSFCRDFLRDLLVIAHRFAHPISRRELGPADCVMLDTYLIANNLGKAQVKQAWECRDQYDNVAPSGGAAHGHPAARLASLRREADDVLRALFGGAAPSAATPAATVDLSSFRSNRGYEGNRGGVSSQATADCCDRRVHLDRMLVLTGAGCFIRRPWSRRGSVPAGGQLGRDR